MNEQNHDDATSSINETGDYRLITEDKIGYNELCEFDDIMNIRNINKCFRQPDNVLKIVSHRPSMSFMYSDLRQ